MPKFHFQGFGHQDTMSGSIVDLAEHRFLNFDARTCSVILFPNTALD